ncbi:MAG: hypothetical protein AAGI51_12835, partial [Pseudomonadota bacterium]
MLHQIDAVPALALGNGALEALPEAAEARARGAAILLICDRGLAETALFRDVETALRARRLTVECWFPPLGEPTAAAI